MEVEVICFDVFFGCYLIIYFADQFPNLIYATSIFDSYYASCINIVFYYASDAVSIYDLWDTHISTLIRTFSLCYDNPDPLQSDLIYSLIFDQITPILYDTLYYDNSNQTQSNLSLFPDLLSTLWSL